MHRAGTTALVGATALLLTGCSALPWSGEGADSSGAALAVQIEVTSDASTASELRVEIDARNDPKRRVLDDVALPYTEDVDVALDVPFPLTGSSVEATAGADATWIECKIFIDGELVAEDRAEGAGATAICEKRLRLGPQ